MQTQTATPETAAKLDTRQMILGALAAFVRQRPGLEFGNYGDVSAYRSEMRAITRDRHDAEALLAAVGWRTSITAERLQDAARHAFSGRLTLKVEPSRVGVDYCTGQYFPTEYRKAVCAVLASALWDYMRENMPAPDTDARHYAASKRTDATGAEYRIHTYDGLSAGDYLRRTARRELGASLARRWFQ